MGIEKIQTKNPKLNSKLLQMRYAYRVQFVTGLLAFLFIFVPPLFIVVLIVSWIALFFRMGLINDVMDIIADEVKNKIDNSAYVHNYIVSVKKSCIYEQLICFIEALIAKKDEESLLQIQQQLDNIINMDVDEVARKTQNQENPVMDIQSLKKSFHVE